MSTTKYDLQFRGLMHIGENAALFQHLMKTTSDFILELMSKVNEEENPDIPSMIENVRNSNILSNIVQMIKFSNQEIQMIQDPNAQTESKEILRSLIKQKEVLTTIYEELNNHNQLKDFCSRVVDVIEQVSTILKNVDKWNCTMCISYVEKMKQIMKTMIEYKKQNAGRTVTSAELEVIRPNAYKISNAIYNFLMGRASNYGEDENAVNLCCLNVKQGVDDLFNFVMSICEAEKVKSFRDALDEAISYMEREFVFGIVVNVERKDKAQQAMLDLENASTQEEKDKAAIALLNELEQRAETQTDEKKKRVLAKVTREKKKRGKNYNELLQAARKLSENVDTLKEVVYHTDESTCIEAVNLSDMRDRMLGIKNDE